MHRTMLASASPSTPRILSSGMEMMMMEKPEKEAIHSGQFMVSHFIAEAQDDEDELAVPVPEVGEIKNDFEIVPVHKVDTKNHIKTNTCRKIIVHPPIGIETSLAKLFQCMSLAYRQKLTSPKWNRFRGIRLRWKDKIRLNNVIWRCWHMQFIKKRNTLICQFASPLDVDTHNKPEAVVLEGKYWKRKLAAVTAEYKKWRMFYRNQVMGHNKDAAEMLELELLSWNSQPMDENMLVDEDYMGLMTDTLFSTITNQPFAFPDTREIAKAGLADFIQPSLGPLQPNLDDYMDTFEPFQDLLPSRLATVPEENAPDTYKADMWYYGNFPASGGMPVHPPVSLPIESHQYPMQQPPQLPPPPLPPPASKIGPTLDFADPSLYAPMISNAKPVQTMALPQPQQQQQQQQQQQSQQIKPIGMELVPVSPKMFMGHVNNVQNYVSNQPIPDTHTMGSYKLHNAADLPPSSVAASYKFTPPSLPHIKFTSQVGAGDAHFASHSIETKKDEKVAKVRSTRGRPRSRSNTRETIKKPPLLSAVSDPSLITSANSALLTQLLKNNDGTPMSRVIVPLERKGFVRVKEESTPIPILPQPPPPPPTTLILTPINMAPLRPTVNVNIEPLMLNTMSTSSSPSLPDTCLNSPTPSQDSLGSPTRDPCRDSRRAGHIHAEQKRRYNIKNGFDMIHSLIPQLNQNPNAKLSKAAMLQKGAEYIKQLRAERNMLADEMDSLRQQIETLNASISNCQSLLPATGAPVSRRRDDKLQEMFDGYVRTRTAEDWKFWIFSLVFRPLLTTFNNVVSTTSMDDLYRSTMLWVEQHCTLVDLRPIVLNSLRYLCTKTDILSEPDKLPDEARQMVQQQTRSQQTQLQ